MKISILGATSSVGFNLIKMFYEKYPDIELKVAGRNITKLEYLRKKYSNIVSLHKFSHGTDLGEILKDIKACADLSFQISGVPSQLIKTSAQHAKNLMSESRRNEIRNLVIVGSIGVYGEPQITYKWSEVPEPDKIKPNSLYGRVKLIVEQKAWEKAKSINTNLFLLRSGHIFGAGTKMTNAVVQKLINNEPVLFEERSAFSNATTINGLCESIINLCLNDTLKGRFCANHVDLFELSYETLVKTLADILEVKPYRLTFVEKKEFNKSIFSYVNKHKEQIALKQSKIGLYDFGISEFFLNKNKANFSTYKVEEQLNFLKNEVLDALYASDKVEHTMEVCKEQLNLENEFADIRRWISNVGYKI